MRNTESFKPQALALIHILFLYLFFLGGFFFLKLTLRGVQGVLNLFSCVLDPCLFFLTSRRGTGKRDIYFFFKVRVVQEFEDQDGGQMFAHSWHR